VVDSQVIVPPQLTDHGTDGQHLTPMLAQIKANTGHRAKQLTADGGYCSETNLPTTC